MAINDNDAHRMEAYLGNLRKNLRGLGQQEADEIIEELRSHVMEKSTTGPAESRPAVDAVLMALGRPDDLARQYVAEDLLVHARTNRSPVGILQSLFRWAMLSVAGFFVLLGSLLGYFLGVALIFSALVKPLHPKVAGLWFTPDGPDGSVYSLRLGFGAPASGRELLGWWIVPVGLIVGGLSIALTTRFAIWCARQYRKSVSLPRG